VSTNRIPRPWWSYVRVSVRAFVVLVLLAGGWMGWLVQSARRQRAAVAAIQRSDGYVEYEWDILNPNRKPTGRLLWSKWLVDRLGVDYFYNVVAVDLDDRASDLDLVHVGDLTRLRSLQLSRSRVTDAGLEYLQGLTSLKRLTLRSTGVTDAGLAYLTGMTNLEELRLAQTGCTDAGLAHLSALHRLKILGLARTQVTPSGLARLKAAKSLEQVILGGTPIRDEELVQLNGMSRLKLLGLGGSHVSDEAVDKLQLALPSLKIRRGAAASGPTAPAAKLQTGVGTLE
jgi:hypothetical protein